MTELTREVLREILDCDAAKGILIWKTRGVKWFIDGKQRATHTCKTWNGKNAGKIASKLHKPTGYYQIRIFGKRYKAHRIIWFWHYGKWPDNDIDHLDGDKGNNCIDNLADKLHADNHRNQKRRATNKSGFRGVSWCKLTNKWKSCIYVQGRQRHLGLCTSPEEAFTTYVKKVKEHGFTDRHIFGDMPLDQRSKFVSNCYMS